MSNSNVFIPSLGILGGGQLGRMMIQETINWNIHVSVLDPNPHCPCANLANSLTVGDFRNYETVLNFGRNVDFITIEIEQVNVDALKQLVKEGKQVYPQPEVIELIKDKGLQKQFYKDNSIPTADFAIIDKKIEIEALSDDWFPCFQKSRLDGYDGKGVQSIPSKNHIENAMELPSVIERAVEMKLEFAILAVGDGNGNCTCFAPVSMEFQQDQNLVEYLAMPGDLSKEVTAEAERITHKIIAHLKIRGILAVEFFLDLNGNVLVNEIAPRPHNSGHTTIEGNYSSQFAEHIRSVLGWAGGSVKCRKPAVMINLLGEPAYDGEVVYQGLDRVLAMPEVYVHLYGKTHTKPFRKMGHVTILDESIETARERAELVKNTLKVISK